MQAKAGSPPTAPTTRLPTEIGERRVAVLPLINRSGSRAEVAIIRQELAAELEARGFAVLREADLERYMRRHRMRYTGGISREMALSLKAETGARAALITSLDLYQEENPPKIGLTSRLVSTGDEPLILWMDSTAESGSESPGLLGLGLVEQVQVIVERAVVRLGDSLEQHAAEVTAGTFSQNKRGKRLAKRFHPKVSYTSADAAVLGDHRRPIAVLPFANATTKEHAGEIVMEQVVRHLVASGAWILEPGVVRETMLDARQIQPLGPSLPQIDLVSTLLNVNRLLFGEVSEYQEPTGGLVPPVVDFSTRVVDTSSRQVIWSSISHTQGNDGVFFFDAGRIATAPVLASRMAQALAIDLGANRSGKQEESLSQPDRDPPTENRAATELALLIAESDTLADLIDKLEASRSSLRQELTAIRAELDSLRDVGTSHEAQLSAVLERSRNRESDLERELATMGSELDSVGRQLVESKDRAATMDQTIDVLNTSLAELRIALEEEESALATSELERAMLQERVGSLETALAEARLQIGVPSLEPAAVEAAVRAWAAAWSEQRVEDYLASYATEFRPAGGIGRDTWETRRRLRVTQPRFIELSLDSLRAEVGGGERANASFRQTYRSDTFGDVVDKTLVLVLEKGGWKILEERVK